MALNSGWVRLDRDIAQMLGTNIQMLGVWAAFLCRANLAPAWITWRGYPRQLPVGAFLISQKRFAEESGLDRKLVARAIEVMTKAGLIDVELDRSGTIITIKNLEFIRKVDGGEGQPQDNVGTTSGQRQDNVGTTSGQPRDNLGTHNNKITIQPENQRTREPSSEGVSDPASVSQDDGILFPEVIEPDTDQKPKEKIKLPRPQKDQPTEGTKVWLAYAEAYRQRYGSEPVRNQTTNTQAAALVKRLGADAACEVVRFYVRHSDQFYVKKAHPIGLCLADAEGLHTQWQRGRAITSTDAQRADLNQSNAQVFNEVYQELRAEYGD